MVCSRTKSRNSAVDIVTSLLRDNGGTIVDCRQRQEISFLFEDSTQVLVPIQPSVQRVLGIISAGLQRLVRVPEQINLVST